MTFMCSITMLQSVKRSLCTAGRWSVVFANCLIVRSSGPLECQRRCGAVPRHIASRSGHLSVGVQGLSVHVLHKCLRPHWFLFGFWHPDCPADNLLFPFNLVFTEACTFSRCTLCSLLWDPLTETIFVFLYSLPFCASLPFLSPFSSYLVLIPCWNLFFQRLVILFNIETLLPW